MPINRDLGDLPRAQPQATKGWKPDPIPEFGQILADAWLNAERQRESTRLARYRHSDAGACARALAYAALDVPISDPVDLAGVFVTTQGSGIHEAWQAALLNRFMSAEIETKVTYENQDGQRERGGHIDAVVTIGKERDDGVWPWKICIEGKSVGGFRFKKAVGCPPAGRRAEGPSYNHVIQGSLGGLAVDADEVRIIYWSREAISVEMAARYGFDELGRIIAEWTIDRETYETIATKEIARVTRLLEVVDGGELPKRVIPDPELPPGHVIVDPIQGAWVQQDEAEAGMVLDAGKTWHCNYCKYQTLCASHPADRVSLTEVGLR